MFRARHHLGLEDLLALPFDRLRCHLADLAAHEPLDGDVLELAWAAIPEYLMEVE